MSSRAGSLSKKRPSLTLTTIATSDSTLPVGVHYENQRCRPQRPSLFGRLRSSINTPSTSLYGPSGPSPQPEDFWLPPEQPERYFVDSVGIVIPGVKNRKQCDQSMTHLITTWRMCDPLEYTTDCADHGITYADYCRLVDFLANYLQTSPMESERRSRRSLCSVLVSLPRTMKSTSDNIIALVWYLLRAAFQCL